MLEGPLKQYFGYNEFRPNQKEIISACLEGKDVLAILPTGAGKSVCYQLPALLLNKTAVVISPLISLMQDQVIALARQNISAAFLNSSLPYNEVQFVIEHLSDYRLLYVAPERFSNPEFIESLQKIPISLFAIDEAHCISQWGHSFRTDYRQLSCLKRTFPQIPIIALTATATRDVEKDIAAELSLQNPFLVRASFDRPNLLLRTERATDVPTQLLLFLAKQPKVAGIIYASTRKTVDETHALLKKEGFQVMKYHAGLSDSERSQAQHAFVHGECPIIVATVAFGMGIHKPDIRYIVHLNMPRTIEQYYQEIGRAGRDGLASECLMFYSPKEALLYDHFLEQISDDNIRKLTKAKTGKITAFCNSRLCLRKQLLSYFGEHYLLPNCQNCDRCLKDEELADDTLTAQKILSCIYRLDRPFGIKHVIDILRGMKTKPILERGHDRLSTFQLMAEWTEEDLRDRIHALIDRGYLERSAEDYPVLRWTPLSRSAARGEVRVMLRKKQERAAKKVKKELIVDYDLSLFQKLSALRRSLALAAHVPAYVVFPDKTLTEMSRTFPKSRDEFIEINGVSVAKWEKYGSAFLQIIEDH